MRQPSLFSPQKQARFEKSNNPTGYATFQTTTQMNSKQLTDFRKDLRTNVSSREPFTSQPERSSQIFASWSKAERIVLEDQKVSRRSPKKQKIMGGLNYDEIFANRGPQSKTKNNKIDQLFKRSPQKEYYDNSFTSFPKPLRQNITLGSGYKDSPQKSKEKLERFKNWDNRLDVQLVLQNKSISNRVSPQGDKPLFYKYVNEVSKGLFDKSSPNLQLNQIPKKNLFEHKKQAFSFNDTSFNVQKSNSFQRNHSPELSNRFVEKIALTDIVRMTSHFQSLSTQEIGQIPRGYVSELSNLADILMRIVKRSNKNS
ncbi:unnamed protein product [Paramecium primaurelia]|uniref:Uncharacterized protein n=1 Tax=Paramecium primaurelia TaxID=5886 RepID=A0A8S1PHE9_PARPR|nr:unnamed protein product [Paramecium primaurelia]